MIWDRVEPLRISLVGAGGLGVPAAWSIARHAKDLPLTLRIIDGDTVTVSNLHRQVLYREDDCEQPKAEILCRSLVQRCGFSRYEACPRHLTVDNATELLADSDIILDATDDVSIKWFLNDYCRLEHVAGCYAGAVGTVGQVLTFDPSVRSGGCLRCLFGDLSQEEAHCLGPTCRAAGIIGPVVGAAGFALGGEALRLARSLRSDRSDPAANTLADLPGSRFLRFDMDRQAWLETTVQAARECPLRCGARRLRRLDLTKKRCPETFLYTKVAAERLHAGELLRVALDSAATAENVRRSMLEEGYSVSGSARCTAADRWHLTVESGQSTT